MMKYIHIIVFLVFQFNVYSQKYKDVDSLINTGSIINNMDAIKLLNSKYIKDTTKSDYWIAYSQACFYSYKMSDAKRFVEKAISKDNNNSSAYFEKARLLFDIDKDAVSAIESINNALLLKKDGEYYFYRGIYNQMRDSLKLAMIDYNESSSLGFKHQGLYRNYSILLFKAEKFEDALIYVDKAIELDSNVSENFNTKGEIYFLLNEPEMSIESFNNAVKKGYRKKSEFLKVFEENQKLNKHCIIGDVLFKQEKYKNAIRAYSSAISEEKDSSNHYLNRGYCYFKTEDYKNAEIDYLKALELPGATIDLLFNNLSLLYYRQSNYEKSIVYSNKRIELNSNNYEAYVDRGLSYKGLNKYKDAEKDFSKSIEINPKFFRSYRNRARLYLETGKYEKCIEDATIAISLYNEYSEAYLDRGLAKQKLGISDYCIDFEMAKKYGEKDAEEAIKLFCK